MVSGLIVCPLFIASAHPSLQKCHRKVSPAQLYIPMLSVGGTKLFDRSWSEVVFDVDNGVQGWKLIVDSAETGRWRTGVG